VGRSVGVRARALVNHRNGTYLRLAEARQAVASYAP
jgi:hypothetical protein